MPDRIADTRRWQEVASGEFAPEVYVRNAWNAAIGLGRAYLLGTSRLSLGLAGSVRILVSNPAGSGVNAQVLAVTAFSTGRGWAEAVRNPTGGLPTTQRQRATMNPHPGHPGNVVMLADTGTVDMTGGTDQVTTALPADDRTPIGPLGFVLAPGETLGIESSFGAAADLAGIAYVTEEPV